MKKPPPPSFEVPSEDPRDWWKYATDEDRAFMEQLEREGRLPSLMENMLADVEEEQEKWKKQLRRAEARVSIRYFADVIEQYRKDKGRYPTTAEGIEELARTGYVRNEVVDPWGNKFQYRYPSQRKEVAFEFWTINQDVSLGGLGVNAEIGNWKQ